MVWHSHNPNVDGSITPVSIGKPVTSFNKQNKDFKFADLHETVDMENRSHLHFEEEEEYLMEIRILLNRNLTIFDYKVLYAIRRLI